MKRLISTGYLRRVVIFSGISLVFVLAGCSTKASDTYAVDKSIGREGGGQGEFRGPIGIAIGPAGFIYISDAGNNRIQKFTKEGQFVKAWAASGSGKGQLNRPMHMNFGPDGNLYVAEYLNDRIQVFKRDGTFVRMIGLKPNGESYFDAPGGVAVDQKGNVYVADFYHHQLQKFDSKGRFVTSIGRPGRLGLGKFHYPTDVSVDSDGNIIIADAYNNRIQKFAPSGRFLAKWGGVFGFGIPGPWKGFFRVATGIGVDPSDNLYVADFYNSRIQKLDPQGKVLAVLDIEDSIGLKYPTDVAVDNKGSIWVVDFGNNRIVRLTALTQSN